jgi:hypothetical protein
MYTKFNHWDIYHLSSRSIESGGPSLRLLIRITRHSYEESNPEDLARLADQPQQSSKLEQRVLAWKPS